MPDKKESIGSRIGKALNNASSAVGFVTKEAEAPRASVARVGIKTGGLSVGNLHLGMQKPTNIGFDQLRAIAQYDAVIRICVNKIKKSVSQSEWSIIPKKGMKANKANIEKAKELFYRINQNGESLRSLLDQVLEDVLVLDAGCIEKVYNAKGEIVELYAVDGATIRPKFSQAGTQDPNDAYVQVINEKVVATFGKKDLMYIMANPKTDVHRYGYGESGIESILLQVNASLQADLFNAKAFSSDNVPPGLLDIGDRSDEEAMQFAELYNATVIGNTHQIKLVWGNSGSGGTKFIPFNKSNKDMQYIEYIDWLSRLKTATYGLSPTDANITQDVNRSTAEVMAELSNSEGVLNNKRLIEEYFTREILVPMGISDCDFKLERSVSLSDKKKQADIDKIYIDANVIDPEYVSEREGFSVADPDSGEQTEVGSPEPEDDVPATDVSRSTKKTVNFPVLYK